VPIRTVGPSPTVANLRVSGRVAEANRPLGGGGTSITGAAELEFFPGESERSLGVKTGRLASLTGFGSIVVRSNFVFRPAVSIVSRRSRFVAIGDVFGCSTANFGADNVVPAIS